MILKYAIFINAAFLETLLLIHCIYVLRK
jgi:hypothetical protein